MALVFVPMLFSDCDRILVNRNQGRRAVARTSAGALGPHIEQKWRKPWNFFAFFSLLEFFGFALPFHVSISFLESLSCYSRLDDYTSVHDFTFSCLA